MYLTALNIATLLGGITAIWFLWDKRKTMLAWIKIKSSNHINPLSMNDKDFLFFNKNRKFMLTTKYFPKTLNEEVICKSLTNVGIFTTRGKFYVLTSAGRARARA